MLEPAGRVLEPAGSVLEPAGRVLEPVGALLEPAQAQKQETGTGFTKNHRDGRNSIGNDGNRSRIIGNHGNRSRIMKFQPFPRNPTRVQEIRSDFQEIGRGDVKVDARD